VILLFCVVKYDIITLELLLCKSKPAAWRINLSASLLSHLLRQQKGGVAMLDILISFVVSVLAGIVVHYMCKWLDR
jgi:hypothetical protein